MRAKRPRVDIWVGGGDGGRVGSAGWCCSVPAVSPCRGNCGGGCGVRWTTGPWTPIY